MPRKPSLSRRSLLRGAAGASAAGLAAGALGTASALGTTSAINATGKATAATLDNAKTTTTSLVVHVRDARTGDIEVFAGTSQIRLRDRDLAARIAGAVR